MQNLLQFLGYYNGSIDGIWGKQSIAATRQFQADYGLANDDNFGAETQRQIRMVIGSYNDHVPIHPESQTQETIGALFWDEIKYFDPAEFKCKCGGKFCNGYPHVIQPLLVQICDRARRWSGHPIEVISGLRCEIHNRNENGVHNSQHMFGEAADLYFHGVTPSAALTWLQSQPDVRYAYQIKGCSNIHFDIYPVGR